MAAKKSNPAFDLIVSALRSNKKATFSDLKQKAEKKGLTIYPVMFGRAKAMLGLVKTAKRGEGKVAKAKAAKKKAASKGRGRPADSSSKSGRIRTLLAGGMTAAAIAKKVGCSTALVYNVKSRTSTPAKRGPGRPRKSSTTQATDSLSTILEAVKANDKENARMRRALEQIQSIIDGAL